MTETEIAGRDLLGIDVGGARLHWRGERWQWGGTVLGLEFSHPLDLRRDGRTPWGFVGREQLLGAVDLRFNTDRGMECLKWRGTIGGIGVSWERLGFEQGVCESGRSDATMLLDSTVFSAGRPERRG